MKITSKEYIKIIDFKPFKIIDIYRNNKKIYSLKTANTAQNLKDLKRSFRYNARLPENNNRIAIIDNNNNYYNFKYKTNFLNIAQNLQEYKKLLKYLQDDQPCKIIKTERNKKTEYLKTFKIIYIKGC